MDGRVIKVPVVNIPPSTDRPASQPGIPACPLRCVLNKENSQKECTSLERIIDKSALPFEKPPAGVEEGENNRDCRVAWRGDCACR